MRRIALLSLTAFLISCACGAVATAGFEMPPEAAPIDIPSSPSTSIRCDSYATTYHTDSFSADLGNYGMTIDVGNDDKYDLTFFARLKVGDRYSELFNLMDDTSMTIPTSMDDLKYQKVVVFIENPSAPEGVGAYPTYCFHPYDDPEGAAKGQLVKCYSTAQSSADGKGCTGLVADLKADERKVWFSAVRIFGGPEEYCNRSPVMKIKDLIAKGDAFGGICTEPPAPPEEAEGEEEGEEVAVGPTLDPGLGTYTPSDEEAVEETGIGAAEGEHCSLVVISAAGGVPISAIIASMLFAIGVMRRR